MRDWHGCRRVRSARRRLCRRLRGWRSVVCLTCAISNFTGEEGQVSACRVVYGDFHPHLSESFAFAAELVFFLFGVGILHSMLNATQFVQGTPRLAASHRTWW